MMMTVSLTDAVIINTWSIAHCSQEDKRNRQLIYACRLCRYTEPAPDQPLVYRNERKKEVGNILHTVPSAVSDDPTLARAHNANCANCGHHEAVFFQSDIAQADSLALIFVCCNLSLAGLSFIGVDCHC